MTVAQTRLLLAALLTLLLAVSIATAQSTPKQSAHASFQSATTALASLPEADTIIYTSPQRILTEAAPKIMSPIELTNMRDDFASMKKNAGIDPSSIEYLVMAFRFQKPTGDLSFVPPDVLAVISGDFSADSLLTLGGIFLQDRARTEKYGSKTLTIMQVDAIAELAQQNPLLKSFSELSAVALNSNTLAIGNTAYIKAAVDAADGNGRINQATVNSLLRDPNALVSAAGSPLSAFAKSFGLLGTQTTPRENNCNSRFGDFYAAVTMDNVNLNLRGAMNTDNPDTAKIIHGLLTGLMQTAASSITDKNLQAGMKNLRLSPKDNEIVLEADIPQDLVVDFVKDQMKSKPTTPNTVPKKPLVKRRVRRKQ
ncbi:MAG TPA: hypothetical protein VI306_16890 [Pyrinomonadaceae bacterium]